MIIPPNQHTTLRDIWINYNDTTLPSLSRDTTLTDPCDTTYICLPKSPSSNTYWRAVGIEDSINEIVHRRDK
jgi:hypothetical protein